MRVRGHRAARWHDLHRLLPVVRVPGSFRSANPPVPKSSASNPRSRPRSAEYRSAEYLRADPSGVLVASP